MRCFISGTDTDVGKSVAAAWATQQLGARYWKPIQSGLEGETDTQAVQRMAGLDPSRLLPTTYELPEPLSPHESARRAGVTIDMSRFALPDDEGPLVVEGAGGLLVPLNDDALIIDLIAQLGLPVLLVCRSTLGTINHTLLSLEALRKRGLPIAGAVLNGPLTPHNRAAIEQYGRVPIAAEIPHLPAVTPEALSAIPARADLAGLIAAVAAGR